MRDARIPKGQDDFGNITIAKLKKDVFAAGRVVGNNRELREEARREVGDASEIVGLARGLSNFFSVGSATVDVRQRPAGLMASSLDVEAQLSDLQCALSSMIWLAHAL